MGNICYCYDETHSKDEEEKEEEEEEPKPDEESEKSKEEEEEEEEKDTRPSVGDTETLRKLTDGNIIVLESRMNGKTLFFDDGEVKATGDQGPAAQFIVHVRAPSIAAFQNNKEPQKWLQIKADMISSNGRGDPFCSLTVKEHDGEYVSLESVMFPGQRVGVNEEDEVMRPSTTGTGKESHFKPILIGTVEEG